MKRSRREENEHPLTAKAFNFEANHFPALKTQRGPYPLHHPAEIHIHGHIHNIGLSRRRPGLLYTIAAACTSYATTRSCGHPRDRQKDASIRSGRTPPPRGARAETASRIAGRANSSPQSLVRARPAPGPGSEAVSGPWLRACWFSEPWRLGPQVALRRLLVCCVQSRSLSPLIYSNRCNTPLFRLE